MQNFKNSSILFIERFPIIFSYLQKLSFPGLQLTSNQAFDYYQLVAKIKEIVFGKNEPVLRKLRLKHRMPEQNIQRCEISNTPLKMLLSGSSPRRFLRAQYQFPDKRKADLHSVRCLWCNYGCLLNVQIMLIEIFWHAE